MTSNGGFQAATHQQLQAIDHLILTRVLEETDYARLDRWVKGYNTFTAEWVIHWLTTQAIREDLAVGTSVQRLRGRRLPNSILFP